MKSNIITVVTLACSWRRTPLIAMYAAHTIVVLNRHSCCYFCRSHCNDVTTSAEYVTMGKDAFFISSNNMTLRHVVMVPTFNEINASETRSSNGV
jgi:hypothetical protein